MRRGKELRSSNRLFFCITLLLILFPNIPRANPFIAYSLREAERRMNSSLLKDVELKEIGGITQIAGMVYDEKNDDLIIVGQINKRKTGITLDDLVVGIRSVLLYDEYPLVSIDRTENTQETGKQKIRFQGKIENTQFGKDMLEADIILKKLGLGILSFGSSGIRSYFSMSLEELEKVLTDSLGKSSETKDEDIKYYFGNGSILSPQTTLDSIDELHRADTGAIESQQNWVDFFRVGSRFWFYPLNSSFAMRDTSFVIQELGVICSTEVLYPVIEGELKKNISDIRDEIAEQFASQVGVNFAQIRKIYPEIGRVKTLFDLIALAKGIGDLPTKPDMNYWINDYEVKYVFTDTAYDLITGIVEISTKDSRPVFLEVSGGIELKPLTGRLKAGDVTAFKEAVLNSKPEGENILTWQVPLEGWEIPGAGIYYDLPEDTLSNSKRKSGFSLDVKVITTSTSQYNTEELVIRNLDPPKVNMPDFKIYDHLFPVKGVKIDTHPKGEKRIGLWKDVFDEVIKSRPSPDSLYWEVEFPEIKE